MIIRRELSFTSMARSKLLGCEVNQEDDNTTIGKGLELKPRKQVPLLDGLRIAGSLAIGATLEAVAAGTPEQLVRNCRFQWQRCVGALFLLPAASDGRELERWRRSSGFDEQVPLGVSAGHGLSLTARHPCIRSFGLESCASA